MQTVAMTTSRAPAGSGPAGRRLWREVLARYALEPGEVELLRRACRAADVLDAIEAEATASAGAFLPTPEQAKEWRLMSIVLSRLIAGLRLPTDEAGRRPQHRGAPRGSYLAGV
jgi:hypothetical protein